jgi:hypothetical protein
MGSTPRAPLSPQGRASPLPSGGRSRGPVPPRGVRHSRSTGPTMPPGALCPVTTRSTVGDGRRRLSPRAASVLPRAPPDHRPPRLSIAWPIPAPPLLRRPPNVPVSPRRCRDRPARVHALHTDRAWTSGRVRPGARRLGEGASGRARRSGTGEERWEAGRDWSGRACATLRRAWTAPFGRGITVSQQTSRPRASHHPPLARARRDARRIAPGTYVRGHRGRSGLSTRFTRSGAWTADRDTVACPRASHQDRRGHPARSRRDAPPGWRAAPVRSPRPPDGRRSLSRVPPAPPGIPGSSAPRWPASSSSARPPLAHTSTRFTPPGRGRGGLVAGWPGRGGATTAQPHAAARGNARPRRAARVR